LRASLEQLAEDEVDVGGGHEAAGERGGELRAEAIGFEKLALGTSVENAERRVVRLAQHAVRVHNKLLLVVLTESSVKSAPGCTVNRQWPTGPRRGGA
jgi:hypothetical protein